MQQALIQRGLIGRVDHFLVHHGGQRGHGGNGSGTFHRLVEQIGGRHDPRDQTGAFGFLGVHHAPGQAHLHRLGLADGAGEPLRSAHAGGHAQLDLRLAELGAVRRQDEVRHHRQLAPAAESEAVDGGDPRLAHGLHDMAGPAREEVLGIEIGHRLVGHFLDVGPGSESFFARSGEHRAALAVIRLIGVERLDQFVQNLRVERVQRLGAVQRDQRDRAARFGGDRFVSHLLLRFSAPTASIPRQQAKARKSRRSAHRSPRRAWPGSIWGCCPCR